MIPILTPTYHRYEKYCDILIELLDKLWPQHPPVWFLTDSGKKINYPYKICVFSDRWVERLYKGINYLKMIYPQIEYLYLIIEDLYPLWPVDNGILKEAEYKVKEENIVYVAFLTYEIKENMFYNKQLILYKTPRDFLYYSQIQPTLWKYEHILEICEYALKNKIFDCWNFEQIHSDKEHYFANYRWPSIFDGFMKEGKVNTLIFKLKTPPPETKKLKKVLFKKYIFQLPLFFYYKLKIYFHKFTYFRKI